MKSLSIILMVLLSAISYGIIHDQITARICVEYFTIGHPPIFHTQSPTLLALGWGIVATWWVGLPLGILLSFAARFGNRQKLTAPQLIKPIITLLCCMAGSAFLAGIIGALLAKNGKMSLFSPMAELVPKEKHIAFIADLWAHSASYLIGVVGGFVVLFWTWRKRSIQID